MTSEDDFSAWVAALKRRATAHGEQRDQQVVTVATPYDREVLVDVVIHHGKVRIEGCLCGWAELGKCHGQHVADMYEQAVRAKEQS